ncbi:hypothetical protein BROUX41_004345 [Berkeleyomyces rouxiae]|uniref:uncharacterized protein n=1 Tax=Berkeleyomyces rouxiae TaxID=2035830 RepID=UPI003B800007
MSPADNNSEHELDSDDIPLHLKRPFSSGIRRQKVVFVEASLPDGTFSVAQNTTTNARDASVADSYLRLVMGEKDGPKLETGADPGDAVPDGQAASTAESTGTPETLFCNICNITIGTARGPKAWSDHEASLAHQLSLPHSHPPSALDRSRMGLNYLRAYGWDPDSRHGLGVEEQGMQYPIKPKAKDSSTGIGYKQDPAKPGPGGVAKAKPAVPTAKEKRKARQAEQEKARRLHDEFFAKDDVLRYLSKGSM